MSRHLVLRAPNPLGDAVMALPAMAELRRSLGGVRITIAAAPGIVPLFAERTIAAPDAVVTVDKHTEVGQLRGLRADAVLLFTNSFRTAWAARRAGVRERRGYRAHLRSWLLTHGVPRPRPRVHQAEYYRRLAQAMLEDWTAQPAPPVPASGPAIEVSPETRRRTLNFLAQLGIEDGRTLVALAPGAAYGHAKRWPTERVAALAGRLSESGSTCVMVGAAADREAGREIESALPPHVRVLNVIGRTDLRLLAGVLASCRACVSNDSGAMHLAAALGVPVIGIFGPTDERATSPIGDHDVILHQVFCRPCMLKDCPIDHRCMRRIDVDRVYTAVSRRLEAPQAGPEQPA